MSDPILAITRTLDAPLKLVWEVHTRERHLSRWWGPKGFEWLGGKLDLRPGGMFHYCMRAPTGQEMWGRFDYIEIEPMRRLVYTTGFSNAAGEIVRAPWAANYPLRVLNDLGFSESGGKTVLDMTGTPFEAPDGDKEFFRSMFPSMQQGFNGMFEQLVAYLEGLK